ncbi:MAG: ATP synthase F0 subunit B [Acidobacteriota bacterium]|nr:ATP synthase F0 subunit B [Acidobacteriota bacterium]
MIFAFAENAIQLVPDGTLLIHLVLVVAMVVILNRTLFRPINRVLAEREAQTSGSLNETKKLQADLENSLARYESGLRDARRSAYQLIEKERIGALKQRDLRIVQVKEEIRSLVAQQKAEINHQAQEARQSLALESVQHALRIGSQILHRPIDDTGTSRLGA